MRLDKKMKIETIRKAIDIENIIRAELHNHRGHFLETIFEAFLLADKANTELMIPLMDTLIKKYNLGGEDSRSKLKQ